MHYEVVLISRETGEVMTVIAVCSDAVEASDMAWEYNSKRFGDDIAEDNFDDYRLLMFTHDKELDKNPEEKLFADYREAKDITEKDEEESMQNNTENKANVNWNDAEVEMVKVGVYKDSTGLYAEVECDNNWVELDFPKAIVEEWFWTTELHTYFPGYTMEKWLKEESSDETELGDLIGFARQRGFEPKRDDGIDLKMERENFKKDFLEAVKEIPIKIGCWDVEFDFGSTQGDVHKGTTWEEFCDWLIDDIADVGIVELSKVKITNIEYRGIDDKEHFIDDLIDFNGMIKRIYLLPGYDDDSKDFFNGHPIEYVECARHKGSSSDFDCMIHLNDLLNMSISWDLYCYIDGKYEESLMDLDKRDYAMLMQWVNEYALGKECD